MFGDDTVQWASLQRVIVKLFQSSDTEGLKASSSGLPVIWNQ